MFLISAFHSCFIFLNFQAFLFLAQKQNICSRNYSYRLNILAKNILLSENKSSRQQSPTQNFQTLFPHVYTLRCNRRIVIRIWPCFNMLLICVISSNKSYFYYCYCFYQIISIFSSGTLTGTACTCKRWVVLSIKFIKCKKSSHPFKHVFWFAALIKWNYIYQHLETPKSKREPLNQSTERRENLSEHRANGYWQLP